MRRVNMGLTPSSGLKWRSYQSLGRKAGTCSGLQRCGRKIASRRAWGWPPVLAKPRRRGAYAACRPSEHGVADRETRRPHDVRLACRVLAGSSGRRCSRAASGLRLRRMRSAMCARPALAAASVGGGSNEVARTLEDGERFCRSVVHRRTDSTCWSIAVAVSSEGVRCRAAGQVEQVSSASA